MLSSGLIIDGEKVMNCIQSEANACSMIINRSEVKLGINPNLALLPEVVALTPR
jgi:hypothetical protein